MWSARGWVKEGASEKSRSINPLGLAAISGFRGELEVTEVKEPLYDWCHPGSLESKFLRNIANDTEERKTKTGLRR